MQMVHTPKGTARNLQSCCGTHITFCESRCGKRVRPSLMVWTPKLMRVEIVLWSNECAGATQQSARTPSLAKILSACFSFACCSSMGTPANSLYGFNETIPGSLLTYRC